MVFRNGRIEGDRMLEQRERVVESTELTGQQPEKMVGVWVIRLPTQDLAIHLLGLGQLPLSVLGHCKCQKRTDLNSRRSLGGWLLWCFQEVVEKRRSLFCNQLGIARVIVGHELGVPRTISCPARATPDSSQRIC